DSVIQIIGAHCDDLSWIAERGQQLYCFHIDSAVCGVLYVLQQGRAFVEKQGKQRVPGESGVVLVGDAADRCCPRRGVDKPWPHQNSWENTAVFSANS